LWESAAGEQDAPPLAIRLRWRLAAAAVAAAALVAAGSIVWRHLAGPRDEQPGLAKREDRAQAPAPAVRERTIDAREELSRLRDQVEALGPKVAALLHKADLLEARAQAAAMYANYSRW
jgi:hypothetical protein